MLLGNVFCDTIPLSLGSKIVTLSTILYEVQNVCMMDTEPHRTKFGQCSSEERAECEGLIAE